jgi:hypothetical protein
VIARTLLVAATAALALSSVACSSLTRPDEIAIYVEPPAPPPAPAPAAEKGPDKLGPMQKIEGRAMAPGAPGAHPGGGG